MYNKLFLVEPNVERDLISTSVILDIPARPLDFLTARERPFSWGQRDALISRLDEVKMIDTTV